MIPGTLPRTPDASRDASADLTEGNLMTTPFTVTPFGTAVLVPVSDAAQAAEVAAVLRTRLAGTVGAVVPGADSVVVHPAATFTSPTASLDLSIAVTEALDGFAPAASATSVETITIGVRYDGEDLPTVADLLGVTVEEVIARHTGATYTVDFLGFAPGFPYLSGLDPFLASVSRLDTPRSRVPAGSVGLAAGRTCIYPTPSPGGWRLLGSTTTSLFDPTNTDSPALLTAGMQVVFEAVR